MHWAKKAKWKEAWEEEVGYAWLAVKNKYVEQYKKMPYPRAKLEIFVFSIRSQDEDNCYASMKGIIDGLRKIGIIKDDDIARLKTKITNVKVRTKDAEHIELAVTLKP